MSEELELLKSINEKFDTHIAPIVERVEKIEATVDKHDKYISAQQTIGRVVTKGGATVAGVTAFGKILYDWLHK